VTRLEHNIDRLRLLDLALCLRCNRALRFLPAQRLFRGISRLGDGVFWYATMALMLAAHGYAAVHPVVHMIAVGAACTVLYKWLKSCTSRPRPFALPGAAVRRGAEPLDAFSFPSGHTLHAVAFTIVAVAYWPALAWALVPFTLLVAMSRLVLGLHYPSDVLAGAALGALIAGLSFRL
jgi:undecaprenyl-diphosphatase